MTRLASGRQARMNDTRKRITEAFATYKEEKRISDGEDKKLESLMNNVIALVLSHERHKDEIVGHAAEEAVMQERSLRALHDLYRESSAIESAKAILRAEAAEAEVARLKSVIALRDAERRDLEVLVAGTLIGELEAKRDSLEAARKSEEAKRVEEFNERGVSVDLEEIHAQVHNRYLLAERTLDALIGSMEAFLEVRKEPVRQIRYIPRPGPERLQKTIDDMRQEHESMLRRHPFCHYDVYLIERVIIACMMQEYSSNPSRYAEQLLRLAQSYSGFSSLKEYYELVRGAIERGASHKGADQK